MKTFIKKISLLLAIVILVCTLITVFDIFVVKNQHSQGYNAALLDKLDRLKSIDEPKIILVGDSNVAFGINSEMLQQEFKMPVVNMGLHGGIGNSYYEDLIEPHIDEGDIVILGYCSFSSDSYFPDKGLALNMLEKNEELWNCVDEKEKYDLIKAYPYYAYSCLSKFITFTGNKPEDSCYSRDAFNECGDIIKRPNEAQRYKNLSVYDGTVKVPGGPSDKTAQRINALNEKVKSKGATLLIVASPIYKCEYTPTIDSFEKLEAELNEKLDCEMISSYKDYIFAPELFFDSVLHLNKTGADARTQQLIKDLKDYLKNNTSVISD